MSRSTVRQYCQQRQWQESRQRLGKDGEAGDQTAGRCGVPIAAPDTRHHDQGAKLHEKDQQRVDVIRDTPPCHQADQESVHGVEPGGDQAGAWPEDAGADEVGEADRRYSPHDAGHPQRQLVDAE